MVAQHYRWDFIGLSTDSKPTPDTSPKVVNGSTFYCSDNSKLYVWYSNQWYEKTVSGGGTTYTAGSGINITDNTISVDTTDIQEKLTAGSNITISEQNEISATDTTYSNFTGTDGTATGTAGLVPAPATTDAGKFLKADGTWDTAGGGGPTVVQTTGTSTTDVMSQNATSKMVFDDPASKNRVAIGNGATNNSRDDTIAIGTSSEVGFSAYSGIAIGNRAKAKGSQTICIGQDATSNSIGGIAIGKDTKVQQTHSIALGEGAVVSRAGEVNVGTGTTTNGYNGTSYRVIGGVYDGQSAHDVATVAQGNTLATTAPTTSTVGVLGQLYTDTTSMHTYQCTAIDTTDPNNPSYTWTQRW